MASAVDSVPVGTLSLVFLSAVKPLRSSRKMVTIRVISSSAGCSTGNFMVFSKLATRRRTISVSSCKLAGSGKITVLKRRLSALDKSFTPLSRLLAVAITLKPRMACTSVFNSGMGMAFSDKMVMSVSCTSAPIRVSSSIRAILPCFIARITGVSTKALSLGPLANNSA